MFPLLIIGGILYWFYTHPATPAVVPAATAANGGAAATPATSAAHEEVHVQPVAPSTIVATGGAGGGGTMIQNPVLREAPSWGGSIDPFADLYAQAANSAPSYRDQYPNAPGVVYVPGASVDARDYPSGGGGESGGGGAYRYDPLDYEWSFNEALSL